MTELTRYQRPLRRRTFIALWPAPGLQRELHALGGECKKRSGGRIPRTENIHLTLVFLGNLALPQVVAARKVVSDIPYRCVELMLDAIGYWRKPRIVWLGSSNPPAALFAYQKQLVARLRQYGFSFDDRPYRPHITLLRKADRAPGFEPEPVVWRAERMAVALSVSTPAGVEYQLLEDTTEESAVLEDPTRS